jgi:hypothetical protein
MERFNRFLYVTSAICVLFTTALFLVAIWAEVEEIILWKTVGSGFIILLACGIMLGVNFQILKMRGEIEGRQKDKTEPEPRYARQARAPQADRSRQRLRAAVNGPGLTASTQWLAPRKRARTIGWTGPSAGLSQASLLPSIPWPVSPGPLAVRDEQNQNNSRTAERDGMRCNCGPVA